MTLDNFIGQKQAKRALDIPIRVSQKLGTPLPNILLDWPPGYGKNEFHRMISATLGVAPVSFDCSAGKKELGRRLFDSPPNAFFLFNEAHALRSGKYIDTVLELLDQRRFLYPNGQTGFFPSMSFGLATTDGWKLPESIISRCAGAILPYEDYDSDHIATLIRMSLDGIKIKDEVISALIPITLFEPRTTIKICDRIKMRSIVKEPITVKDICSDLNLSPNGLTSQDMAIYSFIEGNFRSGPREASPSEIARFLRVPVQAVNRYMTRLARNKLVWQDASFLWIASDPKN